MPPSFPVTRMGVDLCSGHVSGASYFPPRPAITGSLDVFVDGLPAVRLGDQWAIHTDGFTSHPDVSITGSTTVFCNGLPLVRITDMLGDGAVVVMGSPTTFAG